MAPASSGALWQVAGGVSSSCPRRLQLANDVPGVEYTPIFENAPRGASVLYLGKGATLATGKFWLD